ncbi:MAG: hypothetical protein ACI9EF_003849, partial [Pseudohongiellaceae bacterium]
MSQTPIHSLEAFHESIAAHPRAMLFKHSPVCPVSDQAHGEWQTFLADHPQVPTL